MIHGRQNRDTTSRMWRGDSTQLFLSLITLSHTHVHTFLVNIPLPRDPPPYSRSVVNMFHLIDMFHLIRNVHTESTLRTTRNSQKTKSETPSQKQSTIPKNKAPCLPDCLRFQASTSTSTAGQRRIKRGSGKRPGNGVQIKLQPSHVPSTCQNLGICSKQHANHAAAIDSARVTEFLPRDVRAHEPLQCVDIREIHHGLHCHGDSRDIGTRIHDDIRDVQKRGNACAFLTQRLELAQWSLFRGRYGSHHTGNRGYGSYGSILS